MNKALSVCRLLSVVSGLFVGAPALGVDVWVTTGDKAKLFAQQPDVVLRPGVGGGGAAIRINPNITYQTIEGYGAAMTDSSAWLIQNRMNAAQRDRLMSDLFSIESGIGVNFLRVPMGASDLIAAPPFYTYNDLPSGLTDPSQSNFSIAHDFETIIPSLKQAQAKNPDIRLIGSPWSAPAWMKTSGSLINGSLKTEFYGSYAIYLRKFIEAYEAEGLPIYAMTVQNEPLTQPNNYPGMFMSASEQVNLIKNHVGPTFAAAGIDTKLLAYDHNWDVPQYGITVLDDPGARQYIDGVAFHGYAGNVSAQTVVHSAHPDKGIYFTEISGDYLFPNFDDNLIYNARNLFIGGARNWAKTVLFWNYALDENGQPHVGGCVSCRGVVTINSTSGDVTYNEEFYSLAHASKVVAPGAVRIDSTSINNLIETVAFRNPDGSTAMLAVNPTLSPQTFRVIINGEHFRYTLPAEAVASFAWDSPGADFDNGSFEEGGYDRTGGSLDGWDSWGARNIAVTNQRYESGEHALLLAGPDEVRGQAGISQALSVAAGDHVTASGMLYAPALDGLLGTSNTVTMRIEFYDRFGAGAQTTSFLRDIDQVIGDSSFSTDEWLMFNLSDVAPTSAVEARLIFEFSQPTSERGHVFLDSIRFVAGASVGNSVPEPSAAVLLMLALLLQFKVVRCRRAASV